MTVRMEPASDPVVKLTDGGVVFSGAEAVDLFRAKNVKIGLSFAIKTGMKLTRSGTKKRLMEIVGEYSQKKYRRGEEEEALKDIEAWIAAMECAMPVVDERRSLPRE